MVSKHQKPNAKSPQGGIVKKEAPIHISNLSLIDAKSKKKQQELATEWKATKKCVFLKNLMK